MHGPHSMTARSGFNEARASSAGSTQSDAAAGAPDAASMRPAHQAREVRVANGDEVLIDAASMRPAHQAREVRMA